MKTSNVVLMRGDPDRIYSLAANIQDWPGLFPHYRYVTVEERSEHHKIARMGARRDWFPVTWRCRQELEPDNRRIRFHHIGGITKGMEVEWRIEPGRHGVLVTIDHELDYPAPIVGPLFAEYVVGKLFVFNIAGKTLQCIKQMVEADSRAVS